MATLSKNDINNYAVACEHDVAFFAKNFLSINLSPSQIDLIDSIDRNQITVGLFSRQTGKSTAIALYVVWRLCFGKGIMVHGSKQKEDILVAAPSLPQAKIIYDKVRAFIRGNELLMDFVFGDLTLEKIQMKNGNICRVVSASINAQIRGFSPTLLICDEAQDIDDTVINSVLRPMTTTTKAHVVLIGTPKTKNHFYRTVTEDRTANIIKQTYTQCPFVDVKLIESLRTDHGGTTPISLWEQEYMCVFSEMSATAIPSEIVRPCLEEYLFFDQYSEKFAEVTEKHDYVIGVDLAREKDSTVMIVIRRDTLPYKIVHIESYVHQTYIHLMGRLKVLSDHYKASVINVDQTSEKSWGDLAAEVGIAINSIVFNLREKDNMMSNLRVLFEKKLLLIPKRNEVLFSQIVNQQYETTLYGKKSYYHPSDEHDDALWALALGAMALSVDVTGWNPDHQNDPPVIGAQIPFKVADNHGGQSVKERDKRLINDFLASHTEGPGDMELGSESLVTGDTGSASKYRRYREDVI